MLHDTNPHLTESDIYIYILQLFAEIGVLSHIMPKCMLLGTKATECKLRTFPDTSWM